jgi:hypothetical protein
MTRGTNSTLDPRTNALPTGLPPGDTTPAWALLSQSLAAAEPVVRSATRVNLACSTLVAQRMRAWRDIPATLAACRTPIDLMQAQFAFWQTAARHYTETSQSCASAWQSALPFVAGPGPAMAEHVRDYLDMSGATAPTAEQQSREADHGRDAEKSGRRAA